MKFFVMLLTCFLTTHIAQAEGGSDTGTGGGHWPKSLEVSSYPYLMELQHAFEIAKDISINPQIRQALEKLEKEKEKKIFLVENIDKFYAGTQIKDGYIRPLYVYFLADNREGSLIYVSNGVTQSKNHSQLLAKILIEVIRMQLNLK